VNRRLPILAVGNAASLFLAVTFVVGVLADLALPHDEILGLWRSLVPGTAPHSWKDILAGLAESYLSGWYFALVGVPLYNFFLARERG